MRKTSLLVLTSLMLIAAGMLAPTLVMAQYSTTATAPKFEFKLPNGTQDMNVTSTQYPVGTLFPVTVWLANATHLTGLGLTFIWNSDYIQIINWTISTYFATKAHWSNLITGYANNVNTIGGTWDTYLPTSLGGVIDQGYSSLGDKYNITGTFELGIAWFNVTSQYGPHWLYFNKDPANYGGDTYPTQSNPPYLNIEDSVPASISLPYCEVYTYAATRINYNVVWCSNPYFAPPTPLSGSVLNAMLLTYTPASAPVATISYTPTSPHFNQTVTVTVTQTSAGFNGTATCPITNVTINFGDSSPRQWKAPVSGVATFTHNYTAMGLYTIKAYCYAAHMPSNLAWDNITATPQVNVVPEFSAYLLTPLFLATTIIAVAVAKMWSKKPKRPR